MEPQGTKLDGSVNPGKANKLMTTLQWILQTENIVFTNEATQTKSF